MIPTWGYHVLYDTDDPQTCAVVLSAINRASWTTQYVIEHMKTSTDAGYTWSIVIRHDGIGFLATAPEHRFIWVLGVMH